ncbi:thioredoxin domain-containing protein [Streptomyces sp. NPDC026589]|uniref:thioredoxin family protein n=1 Tax=Streptomyces sp. NPDC026589 TaxID=3155609 RepID=UPI0033F96841
MSGNVIVVTDSSFAAHVLDGGGPVLVHFRAEWAGPSKMLTPILEEVASAYAGRFTIAELDIDQSPATAPKYDIDGIPTLLLFKHGSATARKVGALSKGQVTDFLDEHL